MKKILVIKLGALGDFIISLGDIMNLRTIYPNARFTLMTHRSLIPIAEQTGMFSSYIIDNRVSYLNWKEQVRLFREISQGEFDEIIDFQCNTRTSRKYYPIIRLLSACSFNWIDARINLKKICIRKARRMSWGTSEVQSYPKSSVFTDLSFLHGENLHFNELPEKFVLMIPGCSPSHPHKRWPVENYKALVQRLADKGIYSVVMGTKAEAAEVEAISSSSPFAVNMLNKTTLLDIPDLVRRSIACVGNDTGPAHMAARSGRSAIIVFDKRTVACVQQVPGSVYLVSPSTIDLITVDMVWEKLQPVIEASLIS